MAIEDEEDFSKPVTLIGYRTEPVILWKEVVKNAGAVTDEIDVSRIASLGVYVKVSSATTIEFQVETAAGWAIYDSTSFTTAGDIFFNIWILPFMKIRFKTTEATTITIQLFLRT